MEDVQEIIRHYGLQEDIEHVIIPLPDRKGRVFLLKRRFMRIAYPDGSFADFPLAEVIEATMKYPELSLREGLVHLHEEMDAYISEILGSEKGTNS